MEPRIVPPLVGVSVTEIPHFALAASTNPLLQGRVPEPLAVYSPEALILDRVSAEPLALRICAEPTLEKPIATLPKFKAVGENVSGLVGGPPVALPERFTDCGL
jgi:hypothetical protein